MDITGLTGHSGSGKTTVASIMSELGFYHIDCDRIVHDKVYTDPKVLSKIADCFGEEYIENGVLNRRKLGALIFSDTSEYKKLMELVYEDILNAVESEIKDNSHKHILLDAPTLFEFGMQDRCNRIIGVISDNTIERICARDGISREDAKQRLANQKHADFFRNNCQIIIENNADIDTLRSAVTEIASQILKG